MNIKKTANLLLNFASKRLAELIGLIISIGGFLLLIALISYSPNDPNFIFPHNTEIKNLLGFQGSYISDFFLQSLGLVSFLIPITYFFSGIRIFKKKEIFFLIKNTFYIVVYSTVGALFFSYFYSDAFNLYINGNGGFVGNYLSQGFLGDLIKLQTSITYYLLIFIIFKSFSINFFLSTL